MPKTTKKKVFQFYNLLYCHLKMLGYCDILLFGDFVLILHLKYLKGEIPIMNLSQMTKDEITSFKSENEKLYNDFKGQGLCLNMARGNPCKEQLELSVDMLNVFDDGNFISENGIDVRNYGMLDGIPEAKKLFSDMIGVHSDEVIVYGNSSLNAMFFTVQCAFNKGILGNKPWSQCGKIKFLCPVPGYDRHFKVTEFFGVEMINIPMTPTGPDMDMIEELVKNDESIKGIWCVPQYSNPDGISYSDETVKRFAALKPAAKDFRIFWDNAYCIHHLTDKPKYILNILDEAKKVGNENIVYVFGSTSKITFPGAGVSALVASDANMAQIMKRLNCQTISYDKMNQLRHVRFFGNLDGLKAHMKKHAAIMKPKFDMVIEHLEKELGGKGIASWLDPNGGYFISLDVMDGCAKRVGELCKEAGVTLTTVGATYPYGNDPHNSNIRIAPSLPPVAELDLATQILCVSVKLAAIEKLVG